MPAYFYSSVGLQLGGKMKNGVKNLIGLIDSGVSILKHCTKQRLITQGQIHHAHFYKLGISSHKHIYVKLLIMYLDFRRSKEVDQLLKDLNGFDMIVYNCLISANVDWANIDNARKLFDEMPERNEVSWTALISGYLKYGRVDESMVLFRLNPFQNVYSWTAAISGLLSNGMHLRSMGLFLEMLRDGVMPNNVTFVSIVRACAETSDFALGVSVLGLIVKLGFEDDVAVCNSLITFSLRLGETEMARRIFEWMGTRDVISWTAILDMYVEMGDLQEARRVFDLMPEKNEVSWSAMISRYSQKGYSEEAIKLFRQMVENGISPNSSCLSSAINALGNLKALQSGKNIHAHVTKTGRSNDVFVSSSLIDLYGMCGNSKDGRVVFDTVQNKNVVCWNTMICAYSSNGQLEEAKKLFDHIPIRSIGSWNSMVSGYLGNEQYDKVFEIFNDMLLSGQTQDISTFSSVLCACANLTSLEKGKNLHGKTLKLGFQHDVFVGTALVDMYAKSGDIENSKQVFIKMQEKNEVTWTAMIKGLAENGFAKDSLELFQEMEKTTCIKPNELIFLAILFACSHCGLVNKGLHYFNSMETLYKIKPNKRHYTCVVDMLSRAGRVNDAEKLIMSMPCEPEVSAWAALLSGCKTYGEDEIAERTAAKIQKLAEKTSGGYVLLSNVYASARKWPEVEKTRKLMNEIGLKKNGGCSWIEIRNEFNLFYSQDETHTAFNDIYGVLKLLKSNMLVHFDHKVGISLPSN
uniref:pentatricopeptide repeat-containing protein At2g13600-like n=1 Tax=Erigeron canadensis TaxID=72917 RepID=UPI001CB9C15A|nr:pentatricopeptide repeat-containing protein At2g13600-like [Erigeron canadensis]